MLGQVPQRGAFWGQVEHKREFALPSHRTTIVPVQEPPEAVAGPAVSGHEHHVPLDVSIRK